MQLLTWDAFSHLARSEGGIRASVYVPLGPLGDARPGLTRLDRALATAEQELRAQGLDAGQAEAWTAAAREKAADDPDLQAGGAFALYFSGEATEAVHIAEGARPHVHAGARYLLSPLVRALQGDGAFFILTLSRHGLRLLHCTRSTVAAVDVPALTQSLEDLHLTEHHAHDIQVHSYGSETGGHWSAVFHGHGGEADTAKDRDQQYLLALEPHIRHVLSTTGAPLVLAGAEPLLSIYRQVTDYPFVVQSSLAGSPRDVPDDVLHERALPLVAPAFGQAAQREADRFAALAGTGLTSSDVATIAAKAREGMVDTLFLLDEVEVWGRFDATAARFEVHDMRQLGDDGLVNGAVIDTFRTGGRLYTRPPYGMVEGGKVAAILRA